jgi:hypothetical protein
VRSARLRALAHYAGLGTIRLIPLHKPARYKLSLSELVGKFNTFIGVFEDGFATGEFSGEAVVVQCGVNFTPPWVPYYIFRQKPVIGTRCHVTYGAFLYRVIYRGDLRGIEFARSMNIEVTKNGLIICSRVATLLPCAAALWIISVLKM